MDVTTLTPRIREILQCSDLATISAKKVRRQLEHEMSVSLDTYKGEIDEVIKQQFQQIHSETQQRQQAQQQYAQQQYAQGQMVYGVPTMPLQMPYAAPMPNMSPETPRKRGRPRKPENERKQQRKKRVLDPNRPKRQTGLSKPMKLSADLSAFLDQKYCARTDVVKNLWKYIKEHNLQDPEDKRYILCDAELKKLFATDRLYMYTMNKLLNEHLVKPTPEENAEAIQLLGLPPTHPAAADSAGLLNAGTHKTDSPAPSDGTSAVSDAPHSDSEDEDHEAPLPPKPSLPTASPLALPPQPSANGGSA